MKKAVKSRLIKRDKEMDRFIVNLRFSVRVNLETNGYMDLIYFFSKEPHISSCLGSSDMVSYHTKKAELKIQFFKAFQNTFKTSLETKFLISQIRLINNYSSILTQT